MKRSFKSVLIDLSGTLHVEDTATDGAVEALKKLRGSGMSIKFVTNTTKESRSALHRRLTKIGFEVDLEEIFTSLSAANDLLLRDKLKPFLLVDDAAMEDFSQAMSQGDGHNAVVVGLAPDKFNYENMNAAFRLLLDGAKLIAIHEGRYYRTSTGLSLGPGPFVKALQYASGVEPIVVGKPNPNFFRQALASLKAEPEETVMIGDDVRDDIGGARSAEMTGILVRTGKYRDGDENHLKPSPIVVNNFTEAVQHILDKSH